MKKIFVTILLMLMITSVSYAENVIEYKRVVLCATHRTVLVNRFTGEVKYMRSFENKWILLQGFQKTHFQSMYEAQTTAKMVCQ